MVINRTLRAASVAALAVLTVFLGAGLGHGETGRVRARDTTWDASASSSGAETDASQPSDTTWSVVAGGGGDAVQLPADTTW
jgi:hypothetical protein